MARLGRNAVWRWHAPSGRDWDGRHGFARSGRDLSGHDGWGQGAWSGRDRHGWSSRGDYGSSGRGRDGRAGWGFDDGLWGSGPWVVYPGPAVEPPPAPAEPVIIAVGGTPLPAGSVYPGASSGSSAQAGSCVIHQLEYDGAGNYVGEKETPNC